MPRPSQTPSIRRATRSRGFTIIEILAVVGTITVLLGLLLAGLQSARRSSLKTVELNHLRQLHLAWLGYAGNNNDYVMPGYLDGQTQQQWRLRYRFENGGQVPGQIASYYPWRLLPFLDWGYESLIGYDTNSDIVEEIPRTTPDPAGLLVARRLNGQPWFGYNAYYVGGWWESENGGTSTMKYSNGRWMKGSLDGAPVQSRGGLVVRTIGRATRASSLVLFAGSTPRAPGIFKETVDTLPGAAWCSPPRRGELPVWSVYINSPGGMDTGGLGAALLGGQESLFAPPGLTFGQASDVAIQVLAEDAVPYRRLSSTVSVVNMDGNTEGAGVGELSDPRRWIDAAHQSASNPLSFRHTDQ